MSPAIAPLWDDDEWEVCNDDGFIYKRRRRLALPEGPSPADIEAELRRQKRARKWRCLRAIRDKYQREIDQWEGLSASLTRLASPPTSTSDAGPSSMDSAPPSHLSLPTVDDLLSTVRRSRALFPSRTPPQQPLPHVPNELYFKQLYTMSTIWPSHRMLSAIDIVTKVEAQEMVLRKLSDFCDCVDSFCEAQEERLTQSLIGLPIWGSPRALMRSLCS
ncbi:hypothetical protein KSP40_PGU006871 [Platanthera guangdongensis]|uniref:Uncharacterized protein n=1 Tax=Platanthera guangdongensis TaxID=2320717 RepID=A0ABR2LCT1_9ASPA